MNPKDKFFSVLRLLHGAPRFFFCHYLSDGNEISESTHHVQRGLDRRARADHDGNEDEERSSQCYSQCSSQERDKPPAAQPGRPHKRLQNDVLSARTSVLHKKLQLLLAKRTLIAERLEAYENETQLREQEKEQEKE